MAKKMLIDATHAEETRVVVVDGNKVEEFDFESENKRQLAGNIYLAKVTRVEPSLQAAFIDYGGNRHGFLAFSEIHPDYYQIPIADREALMEEERAYAEAQEAEEENNAKPKRRSRGARGRSKAEKTTSDDDAVVQSDVSGMETIDFDDDEGSSPMERVADTPVEEPGNGAGDAAENGVHENDGSSDDTGGADGDDDDADDAPRRPRRTPRARRSRKGDDADDSIDDAADKDDDIEVVADEDTHEDIRPPRKPRPRKYKIQEVIKVRQILLVQVVKEERGNKGAALTTYLSLAGRYCVLMPNTARGGGISRKITNTVDRKKLKEIATEIDVPKGAGLIVRTAGAKRTKSEIKRDYEYLQRMWEQIRELTLKSIAPAKIYEEGDLIKRSIRDLYNREIDEILVEGERGYRIAKDFMKMIMPSHAKNVRHYVDTIPLFARFQVESYLNSMFNPTVQLKSGGYIVIGVTEALVAVDVNSGRATKEGSIEDTAYKTNLEAAEEVARQLRLRDLAGLIVIDFIDMDERKNNAAVEKRMKDCLKTDRARIQVSRISGFGLMEMSRQRLRPGMIEATTQPCPSCHGTGLIRSDDNLALNILRQVEEEGTKGRSLEVLVRAPVGIANFLMNQKRERVAQIEVRYGISIRIEGDPSLISPDFALEKFKTATRAVPEQIAAVVSVDSSLMDDIDSETEVDPDELPGDGEEATEQPQRQPNGRADDGDDDNGEDGDRPKKRRRRRRRKSSKSRDGDDNGDDNVDDQDGSAEGGNSGDDSGRRENRFPRLSARDTREDVTANTGAHDDATPAEAASAETTQEVAEDKPKPKRTRKPRAKKADSVAQDSKPEEGTAAEDTAGDAPKPKPTRKPRARKIAAAPVAEVAPTSAADTAPETAAPPAPEPELVQPAEIVQEIPAQPESIPAEPEPVVSEQPEPEQAEQPESGISGAAETEADKPKRKGWWSLGR
ncbi:ribonuclease E/G [Roseovarius sp. M141]|uniref:ribonuclease E/G n=1 Tax=Roseovarius sp. M141 TaxID=2583806 RepID=UPI0020CF40DF|nr:ribonuclease E/G [Roseovarius sp. M141]MCQ0092653.1 Rne/Rng family ribonuclease [Roseovarius sp. M141]